jgi:hypothetical protein
MTVSPMVRGTADWMDTDGKLILTLVDRVTPAGNPPVLITG